MAARDPGKGRVLVALTVASGVLLMAVPGAQSQRSIEVLFHAYQTDPTAVADQLGGINDLDGVKGSLSRIAQQTIAAGLAGSAVQALGSAEQRRRALVTFALDLAGANVFTNGPAARRLVEWACDDVRHHAPADDFDRGWQTTALALLEGEVDPDGLRDFLGHVDPAVRLEPRFKLADALADEQLAAPVELLAAADPTAVAKARNPSGASAETVLRRAETGYHALLALAPVTSEATVRLAHVQLAEGQNAQALGTLAHAESFDDAFSLYLGRLFKGLALDRLGRSEEAQQTFRMALVLAPHAHAATMALAASLTRTGHLQDAVALAGGLVAHDDPRADLWWSYWAGDFRLWGGLMSKLRDGVR